MGFIRTSFTITTCISCRNETNTLNAVYINILIIPLVINSIIFIIFFKLYHSSACPQKETEINKKVYIYI